MMEGMMQAVRDWTKKIIKNKIKDFAENELRVFRVTVNKIEEQTEYDIPCGIYGNINLEFIHIYVTDEQHAFRDSDMLIINIPYDVYPNHSIYVAPIWFHINGKEYLTTTNWIDVRNYEERKTMQLCAERFYESNNLQNINLGNTQSIIISLKKAVYSGKTYEYAMVLDHIAPTGTGSIYGYSTAANYADYKFLRDNYTTYGLQTIEHGSLTNGTISIELDDLPNAYLLFTQERKVSDNTIYGYRARMIVENPGKAPGMTEFAKTTNAGVTITSIVNGITLKATNAYEVKYVLYKIRGAS